MKIGLTVKFMTLFWPLTIHALNGVLPLRIRTAEQKPKLLGNKLKYCDSLADILYGCLFG
jgi:hypothetical protein